MPTITINTSEWMRPTIYGEKNGLSPQQVSNRIASGELKTWYIKELRLTLVAAFKGNATSLQK